MAPIATRCLLAARRLDSSRALIAAARGGSRCGGSTVALALATVVALALIAAALALALIATTVAVAGASAGGAGIAAFAGVVTSRRGHGALAGRQAGRIMAGNGRRTGAAGVAERA